MQLPAGTGKATAGWDVHFLTSTWTFKNVIRCYTPEVCCEKDEGSAQPEEKMKRCGLWP